MVSHALTLPSVSSVKSIVYILQSTSTGCLSQSDRADLLNAVYVRRGLMCTLGLTNDLIDGRAKPRLRKAKSNHVLKTIFSPFLSTVYQ